MNNPLITDNILLFIVYTITFALVLLAIKVIYNYVSRLYHRLITIKQIEPKNIFNETRK
jgi:hypothetical protein